jgi:hypothetical protein
MKQEYKVDVRLCDDGYFEFYFIDDNQVICDYNAKDWLSKGIEHFKDKSWFSFELMRKCKSLASSGCQVVVTEASV